MKNKKVYRITLQYPETGNIDMREIVVDNNISIYDTVEIAVNEGLITNEEVNYITAINDITNTATNKSINEEPIIRQAVLYQAKQIVLRPRENSSTGKQFKHLMKDLQISNDKYKIMVDTYGNITKNEITIVICPKELNDVDGMAIYDINKTISILNLNSKKTVSVNYILDEDIKSIVNNEDNLGCCECDECEQNCCHDCDENCCDKHPDYPDNSCGNCNECECDSCGECCETDENEECDDCNDNCSCYMNPELDCCKSCDITEDCGCYIHKKVRNEFFYNTQDKNKSNSEPEKTIRIPVTPINPSEEIIMLAEAISKRLAIITELDGDGKIVISVEKDLDGNVKSSFRIKKVLDVMCDL